MVISLCGIDWWDESIEIRGGRDYRFLASTAGLSISISITYILFLTKLQKRQTLEKEFALLKNDITDFLPAPELKIHSRYRKFRFNDLKHNRNRLSML